MGHTIGRVWTRRSLCVIFFATQCLFAFTAETQFWESRRRSTQAKPPQIVLANKLTTQFPSPVPRSVSMPSAVRFPVPASFIKENEKVFSALSPARGTLRKVAFPKNPSKNGPLVVHIQDVHKNSQAQKNIRDTVYSLVRSGAVSRVALEGAHGPIRLRPYLEYPNQKVVARAADSLLKKQRISGPIHAALSLGQSPAVFVGVDDPNGYMANVQAYRASAPLQDQRRIQVNRLRQKLAEEKKAAYSPALLDLDNAVESYRAGKMTLGAYVEDIAKDQSPPEQVRAFLKAVRAERAMDLTQVETERKELIGTLTNKLNEWDINELLAHSVAVRAGEIRSKDFYTFLDLLCRKNGLSLKEYSAFEAYIHYALDADEIDAEGLMAQLTRLERDAFDRLAVTPTQRRLVKDSRRAWLTEKLVNFDLTRLEWEDYAEAKETDRGLTPFESFYREAEARDQSIASNVLQSMSSTGVSVLVTGGYHAQGIANQLTQHGVTVLSFVPKIDHVDTAEGRAYLSVFSQEKTPLENIFMGDRLFLAPVPDAGLAYEGTLVVPGLDVLDRNIGPGEVAEFIRSTTGVRAEVKVERDSREGSGVTLTVVTGDQTHRVHVTSTAELEEVSVQATPPNTRSILNSVREFYVRTFNRGQWVDPQVVVLPVAASMGIAVPLGTYNSNGSGKLGFDRVSNNISLNGEPVPWPDVRRVWAENSGNLHTMVSDAGLPANPQSVGIPTNNVGLNFGYMVYQDGNMFHKAGETDQTSPHVWVVISQEGQARLETIQFRVQGDKWVPQTTDGQDFPEVKAAFRGPTLIQNGGVRIDPNEWEDLRHLFRLPVFNIPAFSGEMLTWGFADGIGELFHDLGLRRHAFEGEVVSLSLSPLTLNGVAPEERDRVFSEWGYIRRKSEGEVKEGGDYFVEEADNRVLIKLLPGYHPHTVVGQNRQGQLVAGAVLGETNKAGATLQGLAEDLKRRGFVNAVVVGNGKDAQIYGGGQSAAVAGAYSTATALLRFFPPSKAGTPQPPVPGEATIHGHLTRSQGELTDMGGFLGSDNAGRVQGTEDSFQTHLPRIRAELNRSGLDELTVDGIINRTYENLKGGKYFIRPEAQVRIVVFGFNDKPLIGPLPPGKTVDDLTPAGDFDYVVVHSGAFWFGSVFVVAQTPDQKMVTLYRPWVPFKDHWTIPSGVLEPGRGINESAANELKEELGLEGVDHSRLQPFFKIMMPQIPHTEPDKFTILVSVYKYLMNEDEVQKVLANQQVLASIWESRGFDGLYKYLHEKSRLKEGGGEAAAIRIISADEFANEKKLVPEIRPILAKGYGIPDDSQGRATAVRWLKGFEKIGALLSGEAGRARWGKAYKGFAATIELSSAFGFMLVGLGGTLVLAGSPLGWAVAPWLGAVFGWRFYKGHFLKPGESGPLTPVNVSFPKAMAMAVIYGVLIAVTPFLLGFGPDSLAFFSPVLAETLWGSAAALHLFFDRKTSAAREGTLAARHFIDQLSTVPGAFKFLNPITADRTNQLLNSGPFSPDLADQTLRRLQTDSEFRASFLNQIRTAVQENQLSLLQFNLLSALLASTGEPLGIVHFLGTDPEKELDRIESLVSPSTRLTVVAPTEQSPSVWERTESIKTFGVNVVRMNPGEQGWTERQLTDLELEKEMSLWLRSVPSALLATVGPGVKIHPTEIEALAPDSRLKPALSVAVGLWVQTLELYLRILQAVQSSA
jgi:ADP-ribose pyrophosphatase YjhB (NUDIX family)